MDEARGEGRVLEERTGIDTDPTHDSKFYLHRNKTSSRGGVTSHLEAGEASRGRGKKDGEQTKQEKRSEERNSREEAEIPNKKLDKRPEK